MNSIHNGKDCSSENGGQYIVSQGDCISSIAFEAGLLWNTIWSHPRNSKLKALRKDPNVLLPGDRVYIPERETLNESCATGARHRFVRKGVPERLRIALKDREHKPRAGLNYTLKIDGKLTAGTTDQQGVVEHIIPPNARRGTLTIHHESWDEEHELQLGHLDPISEMSGVQARLNNLGYSCDSINGESDAKTSEAIKAFQRENNLAVTGKPDDETRSTLAREYGF